MGRQRAGYCRAETSGKKVSEEFIMYLMKQKK
jgi:hypothetical protein